MIGSRIAWRLFLAFTVVVALTAVLTGLQLALHLEARGEVELKQNLADRAYLLSEMARPQLGKGYRQSFQDQTVALGETTGTRLTVIDAAGVVLADSWQDPLSMDNHAARPEVEEARANKLGHSRRYSRTTEQYMEYTAVAVFAESGSLLGYARTSLSSTAIEENLTRLRLSILIAALLAIITGAITSFLVTRRISVPVRNMATLARDISRGGYGKQLRVDQHDEVGDLGVAINRMSRTIKERIDTLDHQRNQIVTILGSMIEGVLAVDMDERILHMNAVAGDIFAADPSASLGKRVYEVVRVSKVADIISTLLEPSQDGAVPAPIEEEFQLVEPTHELLLQIMASPITDGQGKQIGVVLVVHDITKVRRLEGIRSEFVANVSHELKTPITAIQGLAETLSDDTEHDAETRQDYLNRISSQANRLAELVEDLITLSQIESEADALELLPLDLTQVVSQAASSHQALLQTKSIDFKLALPEDSIRLIGDAEALNRAVSNLLSNAIKYTPAGGRIELMLARLGGEAVISVSDTGIGIPLEHQQRIFQRFYRVDKARSRALGGTGLGLSIVKHVALAHGGTVSVESEVGKGSTFVIRLPAS